MCNTPAWLPKGVELRTNEVILNESPGNSGHSCANSKSKLLGYFVWILHFIFEINDLGLDIGFSTINFQISENLKFLCLISVLFISHVQ